MTLALEGIGVRFGERWVLRDVSVRFEPGEVHGLVGHNGSGKSTLIKVLAGYNQPAEGTVLLDGTELSPSDLAGTRTAGLRFVHQDLGLVGEFTALENMGVSGRWSTGFGSIDWARTRRRLTTSLARFGAESIPLDVPVRSLAAVQRSLVAIARAIDTDEENGSEPRFLVLDEPTTALEGPEVETLFDVVRSLTADGVGVVYVSHNLRDVLDLSGRITVLRDGRLTRSFAPGEPTHETLVTAMLGEASADLAQRPWESRTDGVRAATDAPPRLSVRGLRGKLLRGVDLDVAPGEVVCVMGLSGSGREELVYALSGAASGVSLTSLELDGRAVPPLDPSTLRRHGVALVPGNRMPGSLVAEYSVRENLTFVSLPRHTSRRRTVSRSSERATVASWVSRLDVRPPDAEAGTRHLSGGNKQKVVLAKWLETDPSLLLVDEPTAGVDIGARAMILSELRAVAGELRSLVVTTSETEDALVVADRIVVLSQGRTTHELVRGRDEFSEKALLAAMNHVASPSDVGLQSSKA